MKKILSLVMALFATATLATAAETLTVDCGTSVQITATPVTGYHFVRWSDGSTENPRIFQPSQDSSLTASFAINRYRILFQNWDGSILQDDSLDHGSAVSYRQTTDPVRPATAQYTYTFSGWSPNINYTSTDNATYTAQYTEVVNQYRITFLNYDGDTLQSSLWDYGTQPTYDGATPTRPADAQYTYTFTNWDTAPTLVTGEATYTAQYNNTINSYAITVLSNGNATVSGSGTYEYGTNVTISVTPDACYELEKWNDGDTNTTRTITVTGPASFMATVKKIQYQITVQPDDASHGSVNATIVVP